MPPFDKILSRDRAAFPFDEFRDYTRCFAVDWKASEEDIFQGFSRAAGLADNTQLTRDQAGRPVLVDGNQRLLLDFHENLAPQHAMVSLLQGYFGIRHSIRYLNQVAEGDTAFFVVEASNTWKRLEAANPHVKWFFTPVDKLPDVFNTPFDRLAECGQRYAGA